MFLGSDFWEPTGGVNGLPGAVLPVPGVGPPGAAPLRLGLTCPGTAPGTDQHHQQLERADQRQAGHALTRAPTGPCPTPCARLAPTVATIPAPRLQAASRGTGWFRRLASSTTMDAAQISPSTVNGSSRAVTPDSPCERTSS